MLQTEMNERLKLIMKLLRSTNEEDKEIGLSLITKEEAIYFNKFDAYRCAQSIPVRTSVENMILASHLYDKIYKHYKALHNGDEKSET